MADSIVDDLLRDLPIEIWTESDIGQSLLQLAREGRCKYIRLNSTLGRFEPCSPPSGFDLKGSKEIERLRRALQRIADLPPPDKATRPYRKTPQQIAITALRRS